MKNKILISINWILAIVMMVSSCLLESDDWPTFMVIILVCTCYYSLFTYANREKGGVL